MKKTVLFLAAILMVGASILCSCGSKEKTDAKKNVETYYKALSSPRFAEQARAQGFLGVTVAMSDSDIVLRLQAPEDLRFRSAVANKDYAEIQRQLTISNLKNVITKDSIVLQGFQGMEYMEMKYRTVYYDVNGDSVVMVVTPAEVLPAAQ